tara:strand:- start:3491 stop:4558 length:1068 start_codon:yes stop_codon:yes gene_type:complete
MAEEDKEQRTEEASDKRRRETEEKGQFAVSKEFNSTFVLLGSLLVFIFMGGQITQNIMSLWGNLLTNIGTFQLTEANSFTLFQNILKGTVVILAPILIGILISGVLANVFQTQGFRLSLKPLEPKFSKLNPIKGMGRLFSKNSLMELIKSIFKIMIIGFIAYKTVKQEFPTIPLLMDTGTGSSAVYMGEISIKIMVRTLWAMLFLSLFDYAFQRYSYSESMKMTKQELKEERKETEGDPYIKARVRNIQIQLARKRMMAEVPEAEVVITNPIHYAIALKYDRDSMEAPMVVAKGANHIAQKIKEIAKEHGVPVVENKPLAQTLYKLVNIGGVIPHTLFRAVAEVLAYVYKLKNKV